MIASLPWAMAALVATSVTVAVSVDDHKMFPQVKRDGHPVNHPEVVWLRGGACSGVIVGPNSVLSARHCALSSTVDVYGDAGTLGKLEAWLGEHPTRDLEMWSVKWASGMAAPGVATLPASPPANGDSVRLVAWGEPSEGTKGGATGHVEDEACTGKADKKKWGCVNKGTWVVQLTQGAGCHRDSGGGVFTTPGGIRVLAGIFKGPVTGTASKSAPYLLSDGCSAGGIVLGLDADAVTWIKKLL